MEEQVNPLERDHFLSVVLPGGMEKNATVHGSKPVMDLLVTLCATYHLNPSDYTVEVLSPNKNNISFKPNSPIGSLEAERIVLKPKMVEEKIRRPYMPEATVRLLINYNKSHKAVVRVNPRVPLETLLPLVCDKCEFKVETTVLLRDSQSKEPLDVTKTLNDHGLREVFARDAAGKEPAEHQLRPKTPEAAVAPTELISPPALQDLSKKEKKQKENAGFLSLFRRRKKKPEMEEAVSAPTSPGLSKQMAVSMSEQDVCCSDTLQADMPKKRRAPQPPMGASQSVPNNLSTCHLSGPQRSAESTLRSTKRRAPPPPCATTLQEPQELQEPRELQELQQLQEPQELQELHELQQLQEPQEPQELQELHELQEPRELQELQADTQHVTGTVDSLNTVEELRESDESASVNQSVSSSSSPHPSQTRSSSSSSRPSLDPYLPSFRAKDFSDARTSLAKVLTSSVSKGTLVRRLRNSATFPKLHSVSFTSRTHRGPEAAGFCAELESVIKSKLPTEPEWEDPLQRKGTTTFKVVPSKRQTSHDPEVTEDVPDQDQLTEDVPDQYQVTEDVPDQYQVTEDISDQDQLTEDISDQYQVTEDVPDQYQVTEDVPDPYQVSEDIPDPYQVTEDVPDPYQVTEDVPDQDQVTEDVPDQYQVTEDAPDQVQVTEDVPDQDQVPEDVSDQDQVPVEDDPGSEASPEAENHQTEAEEDSYPPDRPDTGSLSSSQELQAPPPPHDSDSQDCTGTPPSEDRDSDEGQGEEEEEEAAAGLSACSDGRIHSQDQSGCLQSPRGRSVNTDVDQCGSYTDEKEAEEEVVQEEEEEEEEEESFPPPPPPVFFNEEVMEEGEEDANTSSLPPSQPTSPTCNGQTNEFSDDHRHHPDVSTSAATKLRDKMSAGPSRFAQAVAMAVQRSRLQSQGKAFSPRAPAGPHDALPSPPRSTYQYGA